MANRSISDIRPPRRAGNKAAAPKPKAAPAPMPQPATVVAPMPEPAVLAGQPVVAPEEMMPATPKKSRARFWIIFSIILVLIIAATAAVIWFKVNNG